MTVLEVLIAAHINLVDNHPNPISHLIGKSQLENAIKQLEINSDVNEELIEE